PSPSPVGSPSPSPVGSPSPSPELPPVSSSLLSSKLEIDSASSSPEPRLPSSPEQADPSNNETVAISEVERSCIDAVYHGRQPLESSYLISNCTSPSTVPSAVLIEAFHLPARSGVTGSQPRVRYAWMGLT